MLFTLEVIFSVAGEDAVFFSRQLRTASSVSKDPPRPIKLISHYEGPFLLASTKVHPRKREYIMDTIFKKKLFFCKHTPPKTNIEPENEALEEEISTKNHHY